jgi:2-succinyl-6-hydroxy-2,4-cyclohexadiene-1-carboxylate synthase
LSGASIQFEEAEGLALRVQPGDGGAVLWIHGYTLDARIWSEMWELLPGYHHVGVDLPGHGRSRPLTSGEDLGALARSLLRLVTKQRIKHVVGLSFGGLIALELAIEASTQLETLVLCSPAVGDGPVDPAAQTRNLDLMNIYRKRGAGPWLRELWMSSPPDIFKGASAHPALWKRLASIIDEHSWEELGDTRMEVLTRCRQTPERLRRIRARTLLLIGEDDMSTFKRGAELIRRGVPGCQRHYLPATGHLGILESPELVHPFLHAHLGGGATGG